ncbi:MAG TPA: nucleoside triphosphate pyrophosphatase [Vitreimonas sp.]|nr:nucleoside triphosphate pyrophosphatase [Vitreimonas sp.]
MSRLILASQSPQRQLLMKALGVEFMAVPAAVDEKSITGPTPAERAQLIAEAKAEKVNQSYPEAVIVAGDTFVHLNGHSLEKPTSLAEAREMLSTQSGQTVEVVSGFCYVDPDLQIHHTSVTTLNTTFRQLSTQEIDRYVTTQPVTTWSGAFSVAYPEGGAFFSRVEGSYTAFVYGLPVEELVPLLQRSGLLPK